MNLLRTPVGRPWRFWTRELVFFSVGLAIGWFQSRRRRPIDDMIALNPEDRAALESQTPSRDTGGSWYYGPSPE